MKLLTTAASKTMRGEAKGYLTGILYLKPADSAGRGTVCPKASDGCKASCLNTAGRGRFDMVQIARQRKTEFYFDRRNEFVDQLDKDIKLLAKQAGKKGMVPAVRINGTSDLPLLEMGRAVEHPDIQFYAYTKIPQPWKRVLPNYHITFSRSENNEKECIEAIEHGINVAVVFEKVPETYWDRPVLDGDESDLRFLDGTAPDGKGYVIGLKAKGRAKLDQTNFVVR